MEAVCTDVVSNKEVDGGHCSSSAGSAGCQLTCPPPASADPSSSSSSSSGGTAEVEAGGGFCRGSGYDMFMGGFVSVLAAEQGSFDCLLLFFAGWKLDSRLKFATACAGIFCLGVLIEFCTKVRRDLFKKVHYLNSCNKIYTKS